MTDQNVRELVERLKGYGSDHFNSPQAQNDAAETAALLDSQQRTIEGLRKEIQDGNAVFHEILKTNGSIAERNIALSIRVAALQDLIKQAHNIAFAEREAERATPSVWEASGKRHRGVSFGDWCTDNDCECHSFRRDAALSQSSQAGEGTPLNSTHDKKEER